ncbi:MAG: uncharacterized membrane protein YraQ (UPF0718 family) [Cyclobacteriaceae bacterium]|jgi:uncharacterized membrane protein YraQ (UPF0718 family)
MFDWLQHLADWLVYKALALDPTSHLAGSLNFFFYDSIKIIILLFVIIFLMGIVNDYLPIEKLRNFLSRNRLYGLEYLLASTFGAITPFCSCSSVPLFIGFVQGGIPLGVTFSFLITSPLVNEVALALFIGLFGWKITIIYALSGILLGTIGGFILGRLKLQNLLTDWVKNLLSNAENETERYEQLSRPLKARLKTIFKNAFQIVKSVIIYVIIGVALGAVMHGYVPDDFFQQYLSGGQWWTVPIAVILAIPLYANAAGIIPVIQVLVAKGVPLGTALAFMMSTVGLSLPEATLLKKVMSLKLILIYFGVVTFFIILSGYVFNMSF